MVLSKYFVNLILFSYKNLSKWGLLNNEYFQYFFIKNYFFYKKYFEDNNIKLIKNYPDLFKTGHILDIGANIGFTAYLFSKVINPSYKIYAFEPESKNLEILKKVVKKYHFNDLIAIIDSAVGDKEGETEIWLNNSNPADHRVLTQSLQKELKNETHSVQTVSLVTIDNFLEKQNFNDPISFIKIDVQGFELAVCRGMVKTLELNPHCVVSFEYCPSIIKEMGFNQDELIDFFQRKKYKFYKFNRKGLLDPLDFSNLKLKNDKFHYIDVICSKKQLINSQQLQ